MTVVNKIVFVAFALFLILATSLEDSLSLILATAVAGVIVSVVQIVNDKNLWDPRNASASHVVDISALLRYALPVWLSSGIAILLQGIDKMGLGFFSTDYELGIYASAFSIVNIFSIIQSSFNTIWQPTSIERYEKNRNDTAFFIRGNDLITLAMFGLGIIIIIFKDIFILLLGAEYRSASSLVPYLIFVPIFYTISETTVSGINFTNKTKYHLLISVGALGVAFVSMVLTVPSLGSIGAALSMSLAYATFFALRSHYGQKCFFVRFHFKKIALTSIVVFAYATFCTFATCQVVESLVGLPILAFVLLIYRKTTAEMLLLAKGKFKGLLSKRREK